MATGRDPDPRDRRRDRAYPARDDRDETGRHGGYAAQPPRRPPPGNRPPGNQPPGNQPPGNQPPGNQPPGTQARDEQNRRTDELPRPAPGRQPLAPYQQQTVQLPRGTGGQRPDARQPRPAPPQHTEQVRRPARDPRTRGGDPAGASDPRYRRDRAYDQVDDVNQGYEAGANARYQDDGRPPSSPPPGRRSHLPPYVEPTLDPEHPTTGPRKLTVTRVAALRSKELTNKGVELFRKAASADGADRSGLTHLTYAVMANYAVDAALAVALANTLFFAAASAESTGKVLLYLLITVAPFALIAPFIGPMLDRIQNGRRAALAATSFGRTLLALVMAFNFDSWILYPCALGMMVLSKSFGVLKAALTPRVLPEQITLVKTNSRLTVFGLVAGGVSGAIAAGFTAVSNSSGALIWTAACGVAGGVLCLRIPAWVESTAGEVPLQDSVVLQRKGKVRLPTAVSATLWANIANRVETGFLALFIAFVVKTEFEDVSGFGQLMLLGIVGAAAGIGGFLGNALGAKLPLGHPEKVAAWSVMGVAVTTFVAILIPGLAMGAVVGLVGSTSSSLAKVCLDSVLQDELPEASRASAFGLSESALQLAWVGGGVVGLLLGGVLHVKGAAAYMLGFGVITVLVVLGLVQSWLRRSGRSMFPEFGDLIGRRKKTVTPGGAGSTGTPGGTGSTGTPGGAGPTGAAAGGRTGPPTRPYEPSSGAGSPAGNSRQAKKPRRAGDPR